MVLGDLKYLCSQGVAASWCGRTDFRCFDKQWMDSVHDVLQEGQPVEDENNPWAHCMVMWGNLLYEASQMYAAAGREDWKATLDQAVENFRAAGCPENDIRTALGNHTQVEHLDLPPLKVRIPGPLLAVFSALGPTAASPRGLCGLQCTWYTHTSARKALPLLLE